MPSVFWTKLDKLDIFELHRCILTSQYYLSTRLVRPPCLVYQFPIHVNKYLVHLAMNLAACPFTVFGKRNFLDDSKVALRSWNHSINRSTPVGQFCLVSNEGSSPKSMPAASVSLGLKSISIPRGSLLVDVSPLARTTTPDPLGWGIVPGVNLH